MKHEIIKSQTFAPVTLTLTFETQEELDAYTCLFNSGTVNKALQAAGGPDTMEVWRALFHDAGGRTAKTDVLNKALRS